MASRAIGTAIGQRDRSVSPFPGAAAIGLKKRFEPNRWAFYVGTAVMLVTFLLPGSLLAYLGLYSLEAGGDPLTKFHPTTYLSVLAAWFALYGGRRNDGGMIRLFRERPALAWAVALILFCMVYSVYWVGISGLAVYVDTFLAAMLSAVALDVASARQRRILGYIMVTIVALNVAVSVVEVKLETHLLPQGEVDTIEAAAAAQNDALVAATEFRGHAFWSHPLTGAMATSLAAFMVLGMGLRWRRVVVLLGVFVVGLLSYGGRAALVTTCLMLTSAALFQLASGLATRRLNAGFLGAFVASVFVLPALFIILTTTTDIGARVMTHLYVDDSAEVRIVQWRVLSHLNLHDVLLGAPLDRISQLKELVGLTGPGADIENPWLLTFLGLGIVGFPFLISSLFLFMWYLGQRASMSVGWLIIIATLLITSTSNSIGRKSPDLVIMTGLMVAIAGFKERSEVKSRRMGLLSRHPLGPFDRPLLRWSPTVVRARFPVNLKNAAERSLTGPREPPERKSGGPRHLERIS